MAAALRTVAGQAAAKAMKTYTLTLSAPTSKAMGLNGVTGGYGLITQATRTYAAKTAPSPDAGKLLLEISGRLGPAMAGPSPTILCRGLPPPLASAGVSRIQAQHLGSESSYLKENFTSKHPAVQIAETKEELYLLMTVNAEKIGRENLGLLKQLSVHVKPKPNDPTWRFYRRAKRINSTLFCSCFLFGGVISSYHRSEWAKEEAQAAAAAANKQEYLV